MFALFAAASREPINQCNAILQPTNERTSNNAINDGQLFWSPGIRAHKSVKANLEPRLHANSRSKLGLQLVTDMLYNAQQQCKLELPMQ